MKLNRLPCGCEIGNFCAEWWRLYKTVVLAQEQLEQHTKELFEVKDKAHEKE